MADRDTLMLLEAIRLEIRAAAESVANTVAGIPDTTSGRLKQRADKLAGIAFSNINLANDEREAMGREPNVEPAA